MPRLTAMINDAISQEASGVHISVVGLETRVIFSIHGHRFDPELTPVKAQLILNEIEHAIQAQADSLSGQCVEAKFDLAGLSSDLVRVRLARIPTMQGCDISMKLLKFSSSTSPAKVEDLGYSEEHLDTLKQHYANGLMISGKGRGVIT
jgi:type II secretory ATPase GspE/PulE/Tfp pilus assembly ATPase PilB-like protein